MNGNPPYDLRVLRRVPGRIWCWLRGHHRRSHSTVGCWWLDLGKGKSGFRRHANICGTCGSVYDPTP